ncbi:hypothetical protein PENANT_c002G04673 [Penicillium antarcticum]|uniref:Uncharacterized protein n=1 Tax=Penicillium antarcticum TaxID=416450 RepID=A0A1V6QL62_9EURO|nr:hypothetical protein PENANT_c002G04673 [Penicillium antarcticum]
MPRAKFTKIMFFDLISVCVSASLCCLAVFCAVKGRERNTAPGTRDDFSSDACAVAAIWLIVMIWGANALRALKPMELQDPMVAFSIFASVTITRAGTFTTLAAGLDFIARLLKGFMIGFAIATGVSLLIYPITSRGDMFHDFKGYAASVEAVLQAQISFVEGSSETRLFKKRGLLRRARTHRSIRDGQNDDKDNLQAKEKNLQGAMAKLNGLHSKLHADLFYSKNEVAWGKLSTEDLGAIAHLFRSLLLPLSGMSMLPEILESIVKNETRDEEADDIDDLAEGTLKHSEIQKALASLEAFSAAAKHAAGASTEAGSRFIASDPDVRQEFFMILYMGHLQDDMLSATLQLVQFANSKHTDGTIKHSQLIFPIQKSVLAWLSLSPDKKDPETAASRQSSNVDPSTIHHTQPTRFPDPEHLPPENIWEKGSIILRTISHVIKSDQSAFGFRVAAASFSVGILAFLHQNQDFFIRQRCIWPMIVIVIGMNPTSGQTMFGFVARIVATTISLVLSLIVCYIVDGNTAGVIVFLYLANVFGYYFYIKVPQYFGACVISIVTLNVIVGYELQVRKLGFPEATSNGQPYYPIYLFGPYKLAAVAAGCAISFFWVIFPYPITAKSQLRKLLGRSLFVLAEFYSCMHSTIELWLSNELGSIQDKSSPANNLQSSRHKLFKEEMMLLTGLRAHSHFSTFEPPIGGKFPKETYDSIIAEI